MSTAVFPTVKKEDAYENVDFETLLDQLSPEEIEELSLELIDPDVSRSRDRGIVTSGLSWNFMQGRWSTSLSLNADWNLSTGNTSV